MNTNKKLFYGIVWGLCAVLAVALIILIHSDRKKMQERVYQAQLEAQMQENEAGAAEETEGKGTGNASTIYKELVSKMKLNDFVFWGDSEMVGNSSGSLSKAFGETVNSQLLELLSEPFAEVMKQENKSIPSMAVKNMGVAREGMDEILVRAGVDELQVGEWALIPEDREPVNIVLSNGNSDTALRFALQKGSSFFGQVSISGVTGILTRGEGEYDEDHPQFAFYRDRAGNSFQVEAGTAIKTEAAEKYLGDIPILFFEDDTADSVDSVDEFVSDLERLVQRYTEPEEDDESSEELTYVVICTVDEESELNDALTEAFGDHYIRHDVYAYEMTEDDYEELARKVYANLDGQGCFNEMREEIAKAAEELKTE